MHGKSYCYQHNLCRHTTATAGNTATGAGATQSLVLEQHSHHWRHAHTYSNNTSMASIHAFNTSVIHITAMCPPPELRSHHQSYAATTRAMQPPPELCSHHQSYAATTRAMQPPPELCSHHQSYAATASDCYICNTALDSDRFQMGFRQWAQPLSTFHFHPISNILPHSLTVAYSQPSIITPIPA
jgi:hypothetical protein